MNQDQKPANWNLNSAQAAGLMTSLGDPGPLAPHLGPGLDGSPAAVPADIDTSEVACLAQPEISLAVTLLAAENGRDLHAYGGHANNHLIGFTAMDSGSYNLSYPLRAGHITALVTTGLGLDQDVGALKLSTSLSGAGLLALGGLADALRQRELENLLSRLPRHEGGVTLEEIYMRVLDGLVTGDIRWTSGLLTRLAEGLPDLSEEALETGLNELKRASWASVTPGGNWAVASRFAIGCAHLQLPLAGARIRLARLEGSKVAETVFVLLRMLGSVWLCHPKGDAFELASVSAANATSHLLSIIDGFAAQPSMKPTPPNGANQAVERHRFCVGCGKPLAEGVKFCPSCGKQV